MQITTDVAYGQHKRQKLDIITPAHNATDTVIIFWHGGSWQRGNKNTYRRLGKALARLGYSVVIPNYRLYPEIAWPVFAEDAAQVVAWAKRELAPKRLVAMGHSAGGQIAASVAFDQTYLAAESAIGVIDGFVGLAGAYRFTPAKSLRPILETGDKPWQTTDLVFDHPVPSLLVHGQIDMIVSVQATHALGKLLQQRGGRVMTVIYPRLNHFTVLLPFFVGWWILPSLKRQLAQFIESL